MASGRGTHKSGAPTAGVAILSLMRTCLSSHVQVVRSMNALQSNVQSYTSFKPRSPLNIECVEVRDPGRCFKARCIVRCTSFTSSPAADRFSTCLDLSLFGTWCSRVIWRCLSSFPCPDLSVVHLVSITDQAPGPHQPHRNLINLIGCGYTRIHEAHWSPNY